MILGGIDRLFINVPDLDKAIGFYHNVIGMDVVASGTLDKVMLGALWALDGNATGRSACMRNVKQPTAIELVELQPTPSVGARDNAKTYDYGLFDITYLVSDIKKVEQILKGAGYSFLTDPYRFPMWPGDLESAMGFVYGPGGEVVGIVQMFHPLPSEEQQLAGDFWTMMDMAQIVESVDETTSFYQDALGLSLISDHTKLPPGFLDPVLHLPKDTKPRIVCFNNPRSAGPVVETVELSVRGKGIAASPQKLGIFKLAFESSDLEDDLARIENKGYKVTGGPAKLGTPLHGTVIAADIEGPSEISVELFQQVK